MYFEAHKLNVVTEKFVARKVCKMLTEKGAKGYTLIMAGGLGAHHFHPDESQATVVEDFSEVKIEVLIKEQERLDAIVKSLMEDFFQEHSGIVYLEKVEILRPERF